MKSEILYYPLFEPPKRWFRSYFLLFDKIDTIIPSSYEYIPSRDIAEIAEYFPGALNPISPTDSDKSFSDLNFRLFDNFLSMIENKQLPTGNVSNFSVNSWEGVAYGKETLIHNKKISHEIHHLLEKHGLIKKQASYDEFIPLNDDIANIIISHIAENIGNSHRINTITDINHYHLFNFLNPFYHSRVKDPKMLLLGKIVACEIPEELTSLSPHQYCEIRDDFAPIRDSLNSLLHNIQVEYSLEKIPNYSDLNDELDLIVKDFDGEVRSLKRTEKFQKYKKWVPIGLTSLFSFASSNFIPDPRIQIASSSGSV